jgi:acyl-CoA reductase-like NAD-dependent aldehyde dehydrogenase
MSPTFIPLFIDEQEVSSNTGETFEVQLSISASASNEDCHAAITAVGIALKSLEHSTLEQRRDVLMKAVDIMETDKYKKMCLESVGEETAASPVMALFNWASASKFLRVTVGLTVLVCRGES